MKRGHHDLASFIQRRALRHTLSSGADNSEAKGVGTHGRGELPLIIFGEERVRELIAAAPSRVCKLCVREGAEKRYESQIHAVRHSGGEIAVMSTTELASLAGLEARHQGIVAALRQSSYASLDEILIRKPDPLVILDGVTDPRNLGAVMRAAECAGASAIVLAKDRTAGLTPAALSSSAGAWAHLSIARCGNVARTLDTLKGEGYWIAAMDPGGATSLYDLDVTRRLALVLGSEGHGIRDIVRKNTDFVVRIPLYGRVSSLNVSVAAAIVLFEIAHRRHASTPRSA